MAFSLGRKRSTEMDVSSLNPGLDAHHRELRRTTLSFFGDSGPATVLRGGSGASKSLSNFEGFGESDPTHWTLLAAATSSPPLSGGGDHKGEDADWPQYPKPYSSGIMTYLDFRLFHRYSSTPSPLPPVPKETHNTSFSVPTFS